MALTGAEKIKLHRQRTKARQDRREQAMRDAVRLLTEALEGREPDRDTQENARKATSPMGAGDIYNL